MIGLHVEAELCRIFHPYLYDNVKMSLDYLEESYGEDIEASWQLESNRWGIEISSFYEQREQILDWFLKRVIWMNEALQIDAQN